MDLKGKPASRRDTEILQRYIAILIIAPASFLAVFFGIAWLIQHKIEPFDSFGWILVYAWAGATGWLIARERGRTTWLWVLLCVVFRLPAIVLLALFPRAALPAPYTEAATLTDSDYKAPSTGED